MSSTSNKVTIVFVSGRKDRINSKEEMSKEFFYSYHYLKEKIKDIEIVEFNQNKSKKGFNKILKILDKILRKITKLPFFMSEIISRKNYQIFKDSSHLILSNDRIACSILPIMYMLRKKGIRINITFFALGIFNENTKNRFILFLKRKFLNMIVSLVDNIVFLGEGEYEHASEKFKKLNSKFVFFPFCVDYKFWKTEKIDFKLKKGILFVGNDGKRDFMKLLDIAKAFPEINFTVVTSMIKKEEIKTKNIRLIEGHWNFNILSDGDLKKLYNEARLTIIPLHESLQPSGQSVALQSMSVGTPVVISKTEGFWDKSKFKNEKNIYLLENNQLSNWIESIKRIYFNENSLEDVSLEGTSTIKEHFDIDIFNKNIEKLIGLNYK